MCPPHTVYFACGTADAGRKTVCGFLRDLSANVFSGTVPAELSSLRKLKYMCAANRAISSIRPSCRSRNALLARVGCKAHTECLQRHIDQQTQRHIPICPLFAIKRGGAVRVTSLRAQLGSTGPKNPIPDRRARGSSLLTHNLRTTGRATVHCSSFTKLHAATSGQTSFQGPFPRSSLSCPN